jgi:hypothetical protein
MDEQALIAAMNNLAKKMDAMTAALGRGAPGGGTSGQTGGKKAASQQSPVEKAFENNLKALNKINAEGIKSRKDENKKIKDHSNALDDATDAQEDLTDATKDLEDSFYSVDKGFKRFGKELLFGTGSVGNSLDSLSSNLKYSGTTFGKVVGGIAAGAGFMLGQMESFAKDASSLGGYADLGAFKVGSIRQAKLMSGLGDSFIKSLTQSQGGFKAFGATTQDAVENVSNLSRGFMTGSKYLNKAMRDNLGPDLTKTVDETSKSIAAMGLSQEDVASVSGMLMSTIQFTAKSEKEAQQMLARQFKDTMSSARGLSEAFGTSAQDMLKVMQDFQNSASGRAAGLEGNAAAKEIAGIIDKLGIAKSPADAQKLALAMTEGNAGMVPALAKNGPAQELAQMLYKQVQAAGGQNATADKVNTGMMQNSKEIEALYQSYGGKNSPLRYMSGELGDMADVTSSAQAYMKRLQQAQTQTGENAKKGPGAGAGTTEADNIKSMTTLNAGLDSLRGAVNTLTASIIGLTGTIGALLIGGAIGGLLSGGKGFMGKLAEGIGGMFGKKGAAGATGGIASKMPTPPGAPGVSGGMNTFGKWLEGMGSTGAMKGAGTIAILGGALILLATGLKTFNDVDWSSIVKGGLALTGLIVVANLLKGASASIMMGAGVIAVLGAAVTVSAYGFKLFNEVNWESLAKGAVAIGGLALAMNLLAPAVPGMLLGSIALVALGASMFVFAKGIQEFNNVKWESLAKGVAAIAGLGVTMLVLAPALAVMALAAIPLIAFGVGLGIFATGIKQFNEVEWDSVGKGAAALAGLGIAVAVISPALAVMALAAVPLIAFGVGLGIFATGIKQFNEVEWDSVGKGVAALAGLGLAVAFISPALIVMAAATIPLIAFGAGLAVFATGIKQFNEVEWGSTFKGMLALVGLTAALVTISPALAIMAVAAVPLIAFGAGLAIFALGVKQFNEVDWGSTVKGMFALVGLTAALITISPALIVMAAAAIPLLAFGAALGIFALGIKQFNDVDWSSTFKGMLAIGALGVAITGLALLIPGIIVGSIALGIMAVAVGALGVAMIPAAFAAQQFAESFKTISEISGENLIQIGAGLAAIGAGMVVFAAGMLAGTASSVITGIASLFGAKSPLDKIMEYVPYADAISKIGEGILHFGEGIIKINQGLGDLDSDALTKFKEKLVDFAKAGSTNEVKLTADYLQKIGNSLEKINNLGEITLPNMQDLTTPGVGSMDLGGSTNNYSLFGDAGGSKSAVTPEIISQVIAYLSSIQSDLDAIRGNTRAAGIDAPVRLS